MTTRDIVERCAKCGRETKGEAALVGTEVWCHPCADAQGDIPLVTYSVELLEATINKQVERIEQLEAALFPAKNALNAVRILMKNQDRREHEQQVYEAVQVCCEIVEAAIDQTPSRLTFCEACNCNTLHRRASIVDGVQMFECERCAVGADGVAAYERGFRDGALVGRMETLKEVTHAVYHTLAALVPDGLGKKEEAGSDTASDTDT